MLDMDRSGANDGAAMAYGPGLPAAAVAHVGQSGNASPGAPARNDEHVDWRIVDRALRSCARRRAALDAEEARWLVAAERLALHRHFGCASIHEYIERVLGHGPRVARDRLRVARALAELPAMTAALAAGELSHSAVRELTRVATPDTESAWIAAAQGACLREIEELVSGREPGDLPDDPDAAPPRPRIIELELSPATMALYREALRHLERELGEPLTDDQAVALMCRATLDGPSARRATGAEVAHESDDVSDADDVPEVDDPCDAADARDTDDAAATARANTPPYQIAITVCSSCKRGWHDAAGRAFPLAPADTARAHCDAHVLDRVDGGDAPRVTRTIPPAIRRLVFRRDRGRCIVPGCRSTRHLEVHHVIPRATGGTHDPRHLGLICSGHHQAVHAGLIEITGEAPAFEVRRIATAASLMAHVGQPRATHVGQPRAIHAGQSANVWPPALIADARATLQAAGFSRTEALRGVQEALTTAGPVRTLEALVTAALRALRPSRC